ncbi:MAG TPA: fluoride efflux transporter CrcB [bacterium]|nr:fluoride efflux transporter CrcB [bacterium]
MNYLFLAVGGAIGALLRYFTTEYISRSLNLAFPIGVLIVNLSGCLVIGFLYGLFSKIPISPEIKVFIFIGVLGSYTTFSTFALENLHLFQAGNIRIAMLNILYSNLGGITLAFCGLFLSKFIFIFD